MLIQKDVMLTNPCFYVFRDTFRTRFLLYTFSSHVLVELDFYQQTF